MNNLLECTSKIINNKYKRLNDNRKISSKMKKNNVKNFAQQMKNNK